MPAYCIEMVRYAGVLVVINWASFVKKAVLVYKMAVVTANIDISAPALTVFNPIITEFKMPVF